MSDTQHGAAQTFQGYCVGHRGKVTITNPELVTLKTERKALQGICPICRENGREIKVTRIIGKSSA